MKTTFLFLLLLVNVNCYSQQNFSETKNSLSSDLGFTLGYVYSQRLNVKKLSTEFPDLSQELLKVQVLWERNFKSSVDSIESVLTQEVMSELNKIVKKKVQSVDFSKNDALQYIQELYKRVDGKMESPIIEMLLTYNPDFKNNPAEEFIRGYKKYYSTENKISMSKGLLIKTELPQSWNIRKTQFDGIVEGFSNANGRGRISASIIVVDLSNDLKAEKNVKLDFSYLNNVLYSDEQLKGPMMNSKGFKNIRQMHKSKTFVSNHEALLLEYISDQQLLEDIITTFQYFYVIPVQKKIIILSCTVAKSLTGNDQLFKSEIENNKTLFKLIALHTIIN